MGLGWVAGRGLDILGWGGRLSQINGGGEVVKPNVIDLLIEIVRKAHDAGHAHGYACARNVSIPVDPRDDDYANEQITAAFRASGGTGVSRAEETS